MLFFIVIALFSIVFVLDFLPVFSKGEKKGRWVYLAFFLTSFIILFLYSIDILVPSPSPVIRAVVKMLFHIE